MTKELKTRSVEIDFDIHQLIEIERQGFGEPDNDVLRRLLGLGKRRPKPLPHPGPPNQAWSSKGVTLPHGTELRMKYKRREHVGVIHNGKWHVEGQIYNTPSQASWGIAGNSRNGWRDWHIKRPSDHQWILIDELRKNN